MRGTADHFYAADELGAIASDVLRFVRPARSDRHDCWQCAYVAGMEARRSAEAEGRERFVSRNMLFLCMRTAVYRMLNQPKELHEADLHGDSAQLIACA